jgi:hypothetical protein
MAYPEPVRLAPLELLKPRAFCRGPGLCLVWLVHAEASQRRASCEWTEDRCHSRSERFTPAECLHIVQIPPNSRPEFSTSTDATLALSSA